MAKKKSAVVPVPPPGFIGLGDRLTSEETFDVVHGEVVWLKTHGAAVAWRLGERLCTIRDLELFREGGFRSFTAYLGSLKGASRSTYFRCIERYESVDRTLAEHLDPERIDLAARLLPAPKGREPAITKKALDKLEVTVERDGRRVKVKFADATTDELEAAAKSRSKDRSVPSEALVAGANRLERRFGTGNAKIADVKPVRLGKRHALSILVDEDHLERFEQLLR